MAWLKFSCGRFLRAKNLSRDQVVAVFVHLVVGMEVLSSSLDLRSFQALINGLVKKNFYGNDQFTTDYLREQLYPESEMEASEVVNEILSFEEV